MLVVRRAHRPEPYCRSDARTMLRAQMSGVALVCKDGATLAGMPTELARYTISELPRVRDALSVAQTIWPDDVSTTELIYRLIEAGADHLREDKEVRSSERINALKSLAVRYPFPIKDGQTWLRTSRDESER